MNPIAIQLLAELRAAGLHIEAAAVDRLRVSPIGRLTPEYRQRILQQKPGLLAVLTLERRICHLAARWQYNPNELAWALSDAERNPIGWLTCCSADEEMTGKQAHVGMALT